jgi:hypothetical protein
VAGLSTGRYALGVIGLLLIVGSLGYAALLVRRRLLPDWVGAPARLAEIVIGLALLTAELQLLGTVRLFRFIPLVVGALLAAGAVHRTLPGDAAADHRVLARVAGGVTWKRVAITVVFAAVFAEWAGPTLISYSHGIRTFDSVWYHLPWAASFAQTGQVTGLRFTDVEYLTAFYPATAELFHALGIVLFGGGDALSPGLNLAWLGLVLLAAYVVGRPLQRGWLTGLGGALAMAAPMLLLSQAGSAANDVVGVFFLIAAVALLVNGPERPAVLVLAAVAAGLAVSVKLSLLAPVAALTVGVLLWRRRVRPALLWLVPLLLAGGFWYLRNLITVGNPLPWVNLPGLAVPAEPLQAHTGYSLAHYLGTAHFWADTVQPGLVAGFGSWWWMVLGLLVVGPLLCLAPVSKPFRATPRRGSASTLVGAVALASTLAYIVTPETAAGPGGHPLGFAFNLRYSAPALTLSLTAAPLAPVWRDRRAQLLLGALLTATLIATLTAARLWPAQYRGGQVVVGVVLFLVLVAGALRPARPRALAATAGACVVAAAVGGYFGQRHYFRHRFTYQAGISQLSRLWVAFRTVQHERVGIVGTYGGFFGYPLFGVLDSNRVRYVAARGPHGSFTPIRSCPQWRRAVNALHLDLLVTTPARDPWRPRVLSPSPERGWTASDPAATVALQYRAVGQPITVFRLHGALNSGGCG